MENNNTIIFRMGEETGIVIEKTKEQFEQSLFKEQYKQALNIISTIIDYKDEDKDAPVSNIVAFCGDRGEGKTSALMTIRNILIGGDSYAEAKNADLFPPKHDIKENSFKVLNLVDPAFFDDKHNLLELLIGQMYSEVKQHNNRMAKTGECDELCASGELIKHKNLVKYFQKVRTSLAIIHKASEKNAYDNLEEIDELAAGIELKENLRCLLKLYADYFHKDRVLICIDDLDLNVTEGYQMCEEIRKYLSVPSACVILMSIKVEQMAEVVQSYLRSNMKDIIENDTIKDMSARYVSKMLPTQNQINMPNGKDIVELHLIIKDDSNEELFESVKESVVRLIYRKTRYIFVNGRNVCPIVPTNLRSLRHLVHLLWKLPDAKRKNNADNTANKQIFKHYFYNIWLRQLDEEDAKFALEIINNPDITTLNKSVVMKLGELARSGNIQINNELLYYILEPQNQVQNISLGDVFYVINQVESINTDIQKSYFLFFLKAFYSIELYETYDRISTNLKALFVKPSACFPQGDINMSVEETNETPSLYSYDSQLRKLNLLQRLLNGSYFTFPTKSLIPSETGGRSRDIRLIDGKNLRNAFENIKNKNLSEEDRLVYLHVCEFFALTTIRSAKYDDTLILDRTQSGRAYFNTYTSSNNYFVFDVLSIFYNVVNIQFAYNRWDKIFKEDFFAYAYKNDKSLLKETLKLCDRKYDTPDSTLPNDIHHFISDAIIRFVEVMLSIADNGANQRDVYSEGGNANNLKIFYENIRKIGITLYPLDPDDESDKGYKLQFLFLSKIIDLLKEIADVEEKEKKERKGEGVEITAKERFVERLFSSVYAGTAKEESIEPSTKSISLEEIFSKSLTKKRTRYPKTKNQILNKLRWQDAKLYNANTEMWLQIIDDKEYKSWSEIKEELNQHYDEILKIYQSINN